ncbi:MAG: hypothetical protein P1U56_12340 [Saprospiraceae bacterium]|nr:hypothetical protein [Saprospiraceae bacterium]
MKTNVLLLAALFSISICMINCNTKPEPPKTPPSAPTEPSANDPQLPDTTYLADCPIVNQRDGSMPRINPNCAKKLIHNYQRDVDALKAENQNNSEIDNLLSYGAYVHIEDLKRIVIHFEETKQDSVFAMLAAVPGEPSTMIFVLTDPVSGSNDYFNFTQPCPSACPNL